MSENDPFRIFASHGWQLDEDYLRLFEYLESTTNFFYQNVLPADSAPEGESIANRRTRILDAMKQAEVVLVCSGQHERFRDWIDFEISAAKAHRLPIVLIEPFGPNDAPADLKSVADQIVGWSSRSLEDAIRVQARQDESKRFDMLDFDL
ncbi:MAG: TIR domain-containing protein [Gammaproteobacteria bacterium]